MTKTELDTIVNTSISSLTDLIDKSVTVLNGLIQERETASVGRPVMSLQEMVEYLRRYALAQVESHHDVYFYHPHSGRVVVSFSTSHSYEYHEVWEVQAERYSYNYTKEEVIKMINEAEMFPSNVPTVKLKK